MGALLPDSVLSGLAAGGTAGGAILQAQQAKDNAEAIQRSAEFDARATRIAGARDSGRISRAAFRAADSQRVQNAKNGFKDEGTPLEFRIQNLAEAEAQAADIALASQIKSDILLFEGRAAKKEGDRLSAAHLLSGGAGTALTLSGTRIPRTRTF